MATVVKVCGINSQSAADAAVAAAVDMGGLNFHRPSPRFVQAELAQALATRMRGRVRIVAVLSGAPDDEVERVIALTRPDFLQLHGNETPERAAYLRSRFGTGIIKAFAVQTGDDLAVVRAYDEVSDYFLFDAKAPAGADRSGGHGAAFDWRVLQGRSFSRPWLLAGGLTPENVARAIAISAAPGVDVSSGVETEPGCKSADLIRDFVSEVRRARFHAEEGA
jgi:phosphoribosylanthranilate isomerase